MPKKSSTPIVLPADLIPAMRRTWQNIGHESDVANNLEAIEVILDADYMVMYGGDKGKEMSAAVDKLCDEHELEDVYKAIDKEVRFV